ncbi:hypothetical protein BLOT_014696 [Blomia tropicalis]|nr:hypothetical protein BLOT_014696 [Blomia tropicalis]
MKRWFNNNVNIFYHHFCKKVDPNDKRHGGELVASVLKAQGVQHIFTLSGGHIAPVLTGAEKLGIRIVDTRHEVTTVFAADASARIAVVTAGPGVTNTITAVKNAQMAESPIILMGGAAAGILKGRGALQDIEQAQLFKTITKKQFIVEKVRDIVPMMKEAFQLAQSGTPGPVYVELPIDILYPYNIIAKEFVSQTSSKTMQGKFVNWYLENYLKNLFAGAWDGELDLKPLPVDIPYPTESDISKAIDLLREAKRPLVILGSQSVLPPVGADNLRKAVEELGIPCYLGGMSRGLLGRNSPINMRQARRDALRDADLVILGGSVADFRLSYGRVFSKKSKIIAINRNKEQLYKNAGIFWQPSLAIQGDPAKFFVQIVDKFRSTNKYNVDTEWVKMLRDRDQEKESKAMQMASGKTDQHLNPLKVLSTLDETFDEKTVLVADGGDFVGSAAYILRPRGPLTWLDPGAFGTLGVGAGFAIGAKLCRPDHDVVVIFGDGSLGYSLAEFDTMVRHNLPIMAVVGNDACWTQIAREQIPMLGSDVSCNLAFCNYENAVEGLGASGIKLDANENDKLKEMFQEAQKRVRDGKPVLVNVLIGKSKFREGSISNAYIGGEWRPSISGKQFDVFNPANNELIGNVTECNRQDAIDAVNAAKEAFRTWSSTTAKERAQLLQKLYQSQMEHSEQLAQLITIEMGKPIREARGEIVYGASFLEWFAEEARRVNGAILQSPWKDKQLTYRREPCGVVGIITPWNFPNAMITRKLAAALAVGCTVVIKPAEDTPYSALALADLAEKVGFPPGVINILPTSRTMTPEIGNYLCDTPDISVISFTGSTEVGKYLLKRGSDTVKRIVMELGGDAPFIVFNSADIAKAVDGLIVAKFRNAGQTCVCANRIFVQDGIHDQFVTELSNRMKNELIIGNGMDDRTTIGPLINDRAIAKVRSHIDDALANGAQLVQGGKKVNPDDDRCYFYEPTLLTGVNESMIISKEETFGPVAAILKFKNEDDVLQMANNCRRGLAGYFYSRNYAQIDRISRRLEVGMVGINDGLLSTCEAPFGGVKESGLGREGSHFGVDEFVNVKYVCLGGLQP